MYSRNIYIFYLTFFLPSLFFSKNEDNCYISHGQETLLPDSTSYIYIKKERHAFMLCQLYIYIYIYVIYIHCLIEFNVSDKNLFILRCVKWYRLEKAAQNSPLYSLPYVFLLSFSLSPPFFLFFFFYFHNMTMSLQLTPWFRWFFFLAQMMCLWYWPIPFAI